MASYRVLFGDCDTCIRCLYLIDVIVIFVVAARSTVEALAILSGHRHRLVHVHVGYTVV